MTPSISRHPLRRLSVALAAVVLIAAPLAACGSDDDADTTDTTGAGTSETFRIGLEAPLSGSQAELGQGMLDGAELAAEVLNADGGILGRTVEIVPIDDKADPNEAVTAANAAITEGLDAVVGPYNSGAGVQTLPLYVEAGLVPLRLTSADTTQGLGFTLQPMTSQIAPSAVTAITDWAEASSVAIIVDESQEYTRDAAEAMETLLPESGVAVTSVASITPGETSYADTLTQVLADSPDLVYVVTYFPEAATIAGDMQASGSNATCMVDYGGFDNGYITDAGVETAQTCSVVGVPSPADFPNADTFVTAFEAAFNDAPGSWSPYTYDSVLVLADAIERAGSTDAADLSEALLATDGWTGWTGSVAFEADTGNRVPAPVTLNTVTADGVFTVDSDWVAAVNFTF